MMVVANDTIVVGGDFNYPPYSFINEDGNEVGYDVDVIRAITQELNMEVEFRFDHWDSTLNRLKTGKIDVIASIVYSESREKHYDFTFPLHTEYYAIFAHSKTSITDVYDLKGKMSAFLPGDISNERFLQPMGLLRDTVHVSSLPEAFDKINSNSCDYVITPYPLGKQIIDEGNFRSIKVKGPPIIPSVYCLAVREGNSELLAQLNIGIEKLNRTGQLNTIYNKWVRYKRQDDRYQSWFTYTLYILGGLLGVTVVLFLFIKSLRTQVTKKTKQIRDTEELYRKVFKVVDEAILVGTVDGIITDANAKARALYDDNDGEIVGKSIFEVAEKDNLEFAQQTLSKLKKGEETVFGELHKHNSKGDFHFKVTGETINLVNEERFLVVFHDITEEKKSIHKLIEAKRMADEANNAKSSFLASVSHEVRTPLNAIIGYSNLLNKSELTESQFDYNRKIAMSAEVLMGLINNVLDIAKIEAKKFTLSEEPFNLANVIRKITEIQQFKVSEKNLNFQVDINKNLPEWIIGDELRLTQVLLNILNNALKFTEKGSIILKVNYENLNSLKRKKVLFSVKDTGVGIASDKIDEVFKPFEQVENTTSRMYSGTGLGLPITKHLVELMDGEILIESEPNNGTVVNISIPFDVVTDTAKHIYAEEKQEPVNNIAGISILLVEDNAFNAEIFIEQLVEFDLKITLAQDGYKAIEILKENNFDVILMDIEMPGLDGYETTKEIRKQQLSNAPIIALSAHTLQSEKEKAKEAGMIEHLGKPIEIEKIIEVIKKATVNNNILLEKDKAIALFGGNVDIYNRALNRFVQNYSDISRKILSLYECNSENLFTVFHNLKSALKTIGALNLSKKAEYFEQEFNNNGNVADKDMVVKFTKDLDALISAILADE